MVAAGMMLDLQDNITTSHTAIIQFDSQLSYTETVNLTSVLSSFGDIEILIGSATGENLWTGVVYFMAKNSLGNLFIQLDTQQNTIQTLLHPKDAYYAHIAILSNCQLGQVRYTPE